MDKKTSFPPVTVLIDLLFILLIIVLINEDETTVEIPENMIFKNAILVYDDGGLKYEMNQQTREPKKLLLLDKNIKYVYSKPCKTQCLEYADEFQGKLHIYFPDTLFNNISKITFIATDTSYNCKNIKFNITEEGIINLKKLKENKCLEKIDGLKDLLEV